MKAKERKVARKLRQQGKSLREITKKIKCSKSSISRWIQDIPLTEEQIERLKSNQDKGRAKASRHAHASRKKWERIRNSIKASARIEIPLSCSLEMLKLVGTALYWAEGYNASRNSIVFANTDPKMIELMMLFFRKVCKVPKAKFRGKISIHPHLDAKKAELYWSKISKIPLAQFNKPLLAVSRSSKSKKDTLPLGTFRIIISDVYTCSKIKGWIEAIGEWANKRGRLAQLARASALHAGGQRFKSSTAHHLHRRISNAYYIYNSGIGSRNRRWFLGDR